jgi:hypothetical protein
MGWFGKRLGSAGLAMNLAKAAGETRRRRPIGRESICPL